MRYLTIVGLLGLLITLAMGMLPALANPPQQGPIPIRYGQSVSGTISEEATSLSFVFDGEQGDRITATVIGTGDLEPTLQLTNFSGTLLADDAGTGTIFFTIPADGAYVLVVSRVGETTGGFELSLESGAIPPTNTPSPTSEITGTDIPPAATTPPPSVIDIPDTAAEQRLRNLSLGSTVQGELGDERTFDLYWFGSSGNENIVIIPDDTAELLPLLVLYDQELAEISRAQPGQTLDVQLATPGLYFIAAGLLQLDDSGQYQFSLVESQPVTAASDGQDGLTYGQTASGNISNTNPNRRYRFFGFAGDQVAISMETVSGDLDSYLLLLDSSGTTLAQDDNSGAGETDALLETTLPARGEYFIIATRRGQDQGFTAGNYLLRLDSDAPPRAVPTEEAVLPQIYADFPLIAYGDTFSGEITNASFLNVYVFQGNAGDTVEISMRSEGSLDPLLFLLDEERIPLAENDDIADGNQDSQIQFELPRTGYYGIVATRFEQAEGNTIGTYELSLDLAGAVTIAPGENIIENLDTVRLVPGDTAAGEFSALSFGNFYVFSATTGNLIDVAVRTDGGTPVTVILADSGLNPVDVADDNVLLAAEAPASDDYLVIVAPQQGPAVSVEDGYVVALNAEASTGDGGETTTEDDEGETVIASGEDTRSLAYGSSARGTIDEEDNADRYVFRGREGDIIEITMESTGPTLLDTYLTLLDPEGEVVGENDDINPGIVRNSRLSATLPDDGEYTIIATRYEGETAELTTGEYEITLIFQDPAVAGVDREPVEIGYGQTLSSSIDDDIYLRFFYFEGQQNDEVVIEVDVTEGLLDGVMYLYTFTSSGEPLQLAANDDSPLGNTFDPYIEYTLPRTGRYLIAVTRYVQNTADDTLTSGTFNLTLRRQATEQ
jgi:hypothetical protein